MQKIFILLLITIPTMAFSQIDTAFLQRLKGMETGDLLKTDTMAVPNDAFTRKIKELRKEKNGLNIELVMQIKIKEEQEKDSSTKRVLRQAAPGNDHRRNRSLIRKLYGQYVP